MSTIEQTRTRGANEEHHSPRWNDLIGPQGEALIVELRAAKQTIDAARHASRRPSAVSGDRKGVGPEQTLRFPRPRESLDHFDIRSLLNPTRVKGVGDRVLPKTRVAIESA